LQRRGVEFAPVRLGAAEIILRQQSPEHGAIREQRDSVIPAKRRHRGFGPAIDERVLHLVRHDADSVISDDAQTLGVEVSEREMMNLALALQVGEIFEGVEIARVSIVPPVKFA
jgi:hypothetical protein